MKENIVLANEYLNKWCNTEGINFYEGIEALGNLFKWAVPKLHYASLSFQPCWKWNYLAEVDGYSFNGQDPALTLFWAIGEVMK